VSGELQALRAERKALLATRAELDRARISLTVRQIRTIVAPAPPADRVGRLRPAAGFLTAIVGAAAGAPRLARWLRFATFALAAVRVVRNWR
jgi:hypothetical protein